MQIISQTEKEVIVKFESAEIKALSGQYNENLIYSFTPQQLEAIKEKINQSTKQQQQQQQQQKPQTNKN
jgi:uncharacterized spore protein YtfJ